MQEERRTTSSSSSAMLSSAHHEDDDYQDAVRMNCGWLPPHEDLPSTAVLRRRGVVQLVAGSAVLGALLLLTVVLATTTTRTTPLHWPSFTPPSDPRRSTGLFTTASSAAFPARPTSQATTTWRRYLRRSEGATTSTNTGAELEHPERRASRSNNKTDTHSHDSSSNASSTRSSTKNTTIAAITTDATPGKPTQHHHQNANTTAVSLPPALTETEVPEDVEVLDAEVKQELQQEGDLAAPGSSSSSEVRVEHGEDEDDQDTDANDNKDAAAHDNKVAVTSPSPAPSAAAAGKTDSGAAPAPAPSEAPQQHPPDKVSPAATLPGAESEESEEQLLAKEEAKVRRVSGFGAVAALAAMIFTAWQMSENPDGIYAATCRLILTVCHLVIRLAVAPCHKCCPGCCSWCIPSLSGASATGLGSAGGGAHYRHSYGHVPAALDYGYRDPSLELS